MQPDILRFLLLARAHLRDSAHDDKADDRHPDMQAIDRALPDSDWFERAEFQPVAQVRASDLWVEQARLHF